MFEELVEELNPVDKLRSLLIGRILNSYSVKYFVITMSMKYMLEQQISEDFWVIDIRYDIRLYGVRKIKLDQVIIFSNMSTGYSFMKKRFRYEWVGGLYNLADFVEGLDIEVNDLGFGHSLTEIIIEEAYESVHI